MASRHEAQDELDTVIAEWAATREAGAASAELQAAGVCAAPVLTPLTVTQDAHLLERKAFLTYDHPVTGTVGCSAPAWRMQRRPITSVEPAPSFGQHTDDVLIRVAGYSVEELAELRANNVITDDLLPTTAG